jgi:hypothetical protein
VSRLEHLLNALGSQLTVLPTRRRLVSAASRATLSFATVETATSSVDNRIQFQPEMTRRTCRGED